MRCGGADEPITTRPNLPVIEVTEFETLAKLAERCGLLVLHWSRTDVDTYVVLDEGTTYRYRTGIGVRAEPAAKASESSACSEGRDVDHLHDGAAEPVRHRP